MKANYMFAVELNQNFVGWFIKWNKKINDELAKLAFPKSYRTNFISSILSFDFKIKCIDSSNRIPKKKNVSKVSNMYLLRKNIYSV